MTSLPFLIGSITLSLCACATAASAQEKSAAPADFQALLDCRAIADPQQRLGCYDEKVSAVEDARVRSDLIVADREQVREAKRGLFGLTLPQMKLFSREGDEEINEVEATIARLSRNPSGKHTFLLDDGAVWAQTDTQAVYPKKGDKIRIRRAAMGSFFANINGGSAIRVRREN